MQKLLTQASQDNSIKPDVVIVVVNLKSKIWARSLVVSLVLVIKRLSNSELVPLKSSSHLQK